MPIKHAFGPTITTDHLPNGPQTVDDKIRVFEDQIRGWKLDIAEEALANNGHAGFAVLDIVTSYFELIGLCIEGRGKKKRVPKRGGGTKQAKWGSGDYFRAGMQHVFPRLKQAPTPLLERVLAAFYKDVRCGLYHQAMTRNGVLLSGAFNSPIRFRTAKAGTLILINPKRLVEALKNHLRAYVRQISNAANVDDRARFEDVFDSR
jgi:hypothetical protein